MISHLPPHDEALQSPAGCKWLELSLAQRAVWLDASLSNSATAYTLVRWARIQGEFDPQIAQQALTLVVARHDAMRLRVDTELPRQWLHDSSEAPFTVVDLSHASDTDLARRGFVEKSLASAMPLGDNSLFSFEVAKLQTRDYYLLMRCHHLLADEAGVSMMLNHWFGAYFALSSQTAMELAPPSSYLAVIESDLVYSESPGYKQDLDYWAGRFKSLSPPLLGPKSSSAAGGHLLPYTFKWTLEKDLYKQLKLLVKEAGVTAQRAILALFMVVLARRYGQSDVTVGMALHRRDASNLHVVGMLAGMIGVRFQLDSEASLIDIVRGVSIQVDRDLRHQRLPIDALARAIGSSRSGLAEIFQVAFSFLPADRGSSAPPFEGLTLQTGVISSREASPLTFHVQELAGDEGLALTIASQPEFVDAVETERLASLFDRLVSLFVEDQDSEVATFQATTLSEREQVVNGWNETEATYAKGTADQFFQQAVLRTPYATAVLSAAGSLSYAELDVRSNQLAHLLIERGFTPQCVAGVALERSISTVVSLLAILKAGGIYLPLDPAYPSDRLAHMLSDSGASLVIADSTIAASLPVHLDQLLMDAPDCYSSQPVSVPAAAHSADDTAYIIYTSGSTGKPKGVAVPHSAAVNLAFARLLHDPIASGDRILAAISVGFDVSIGQLLLPLLSGATIVIAGDLRTMTASEFWSFLDTYQVTHINSVPSFVESILEAAPQSSTLQRLMLGGEPLSSALVRRVQRMLPDVQVVNMYGPTEACIDATCYIASGHETTATLPIGKPLPNYRTYILDAHLNPVGIGIAGDLYLAGAGLAHGYLNQPEITAERFIADPFRRSGERLYNTGDRARWLGDGNIEFLGRADTQVKIRGHRIELGEIEAALLLHPSIAQATVIANTDAPGPARLVAYFVPHSLERLPDSAQLRMHLGTHLPEYMIPAAFCRLAAFPLTANGKLDIRALPPVDWQSSKEYVEPRTAAETVIASCFAELLGISRVGLHDNFFELGGHSLLATRLASQLRTQLGVAIPLRYIFDFPTVEGLAGYFGSLGDDRSLVLAAADRPEKLPLSFTQERLWFLSQLQRDNTYNIPLAVRLRGQLNVGRVIFALKQIVQRHEVLRTSIVISDGSPVQQVQDAGLFQVEQVHLDASELNERLRGLADHCFDLANELPIKAELITVGAEDHIAAVVVHHAAFDGWSASLFFQEFAAIYSAHNPGHALPQLPLQYADFALWEREQQFASDVDYWVKQLASAPPRLEFPFDSAPIELARRPAGSVPFSLSGALHESLVKVANVNGASLFMLLHAAFAALLARWSGQDDIVIGTAVANRTRAEFEPIIGCFVNTLALRTRLQPSESFTSLLTRVREDDLSAFEHQAVPFDKLVDVLQPERSLFQTPLFQAMLVLQNMPVPAFELPSLSLEMLPLDPTAAKFNLTLNLTHQTKDGSLAGALEYAADLYKASTIGRFVDQFQRLLQLIALDPNQTVMQLDLLPSSEREQVVSGWNETEATYPKGTADHFFQQAVLRTPLATAVLSAAGSLSYSDLDARSNQLAHLLIERGFTPQCVAGVALERSISTVVSLLAILKAGGIYLPLDPAYPADRLAHMLSDSGASLVITDSTIAPSLPAHLDQILMDVPDCYSSQPVSVPAAAHSADDTAYIIYTSGSTGKPKGVAVPHSAAVSLAFGRQLHDPIGSGDRILAAISVGFDVSIGQLLLPLFSGATIVIADDLRTMAASEFWLFLDTYQVTHINSVPSFVESILEAAPQSSTLHRLMLGGEPLSSALVRRVQRMLPDVQVVNMYGPTEACIDATCYIASGQETTATLPIGKPLPNYRTYILDAHLNAVGIGIAGDLYLAGAGLAHGYLNQPELTAERFIADPFGRSGERLYNTGDRARWLADGNIEFLGRADTQVKIRGHRIELGEIEAQLGSYPGLLETAVTVREDTPGDQRLVAYYLAGEPVPVDQLRAAVAAVLPGYMVPSAYVRLDSFPLTANGKLDRKALPAPHADAFPVRPFEPPQGSREEQVAQAFSDILKLPQVGRHDNFFELGGHSLMAITLIERLRAGDLQLDVRDLFTTPTVAGLAAVAQQSSAHFHAPPNNIPVESSSITPEMLPLVVLSQQEINSIVAQVPGGVSNVQDIYPLAPLQEGILFHHLMSTQGDAYLTPFLLSFDRRGRLELFLDALKEIIARHDILRTAIVWENIHEPVQVVLKNAPLVSEEVPLDTHSRVAAADQLLDLYDPKRFRIDIRQAPMLRAYFTRDESSDRWLLLLLTHHLILDHTSLEIVLNEVKLISSGNRAALPPPFPFRNFVAQARQGTQAQEHETFFTELLADITEPTTPYGLTQIQGNGDGIRESSFTLKQELSKRLRERARSLGVGPAAIFHLAWALVLAHVSDRRDVVFGTLLSGRMQSGEASHRTPGLFINTLPLRVKIDNRTVLSGLQETHQALAGLLQHEQASLALAQRCSGVPAPTPLFSALFNFRHSPAAYASGDKGGWPGVELIFAQERTDYPVAVAIDDRTNDFLVTAQADSPVDPAQLCRLLDTAVSSLLEAMDRRPRQSLRDISVLPASDVQEVTMAFNQTAASYKDSTLQAAIELQSSLTPDAVAVVHLSESFTYAQLNAEAERLANSLAAHGVGLQTVVGVALPRSASTVVSLLAILKLGAIYLPLDPAYPTDRLAYMIADSEVGLVITDDATEPLISSDVPRLNINKIPPASHSARPELTPNYTAYIIYTSGSTGKPKGVAVPHLAAVNLAFARLAHDPISSGDRILAAISVGFDVSIGQLLLPLLSGATIVIASDLRSLSAQEFWEFLATNHVTHINSVPSFFESILDAAPTTSTLNRLMLGGEPLSSSLVRRLRQALPNTQVVNMYGPTEACIDATCYPASGLEPAAVLPIGKPLPNYRAYILNDRLDPLAVGVAGDLYLAGAGLAHGYIKQPALTAERFIANPFAGNGERLYKTGDRARWCSDGDIDFLGRADTQVKIRGHRIELGEIESALLLHPAIIQTAVIANADQSRLVAYFVLRLAMAKPDSQQLRAHLATQVPEYMIPSAFHELSALPLTQNGKLDLKALPKLSSDRSTQVPFVEPRSATETGMQKLWQQVLDVQSIGIHDNFFSLGGHSLAVMRLINLCNSQFQVSLPMRFLFDYPTIAELSAAIDSNVKTDAHPSLVPLRSSGSKTPLFCIHPAGGAVLRYGPLTAALKPDQPVYGLQARALLEGQPLASSIVETATDYVAAIRSVQPNGPYQLLGWSSGGVVAYEMAQQLNRVAEEVAFLGLMDSSLPASMKKDPKEADLLHAFAVTFGFDDLLTKPAKPKGSDEFLERIHSAGRLPQGSELPQFKRFHKVFCNTLRIYPKYDPKPWQGAFVLFRALKRSSPMPDWSALTSANANLIDMDCTHADLPSEEQAPILAAHIENFLLKANHGTKL